MTCGTISDDRIYFCCQTFHYTHKISFSLKLPWKRLNIHYSIPEMINSKQVFQRCTNPVFQRFTSPVFQRCTNPVFQRCTNPVFQRWTNPVFQRCTNPVFQRCTNPVFHRSSVPEMHKSIFQKCTPLNTVPGIHKSRLPVQGKPTAARGHSSATLSTHTKQSTYKNIKTNTLCKYIVLIPRL